MLFDLIYIDNLPNNIPATIHLQTNILMIKTLNND